MLKTTLRFDPGARLTNEQRDAPSVRVFDGNGAAGSLAEDLD
jgi:hypothetical protein